MIVRKIDIKEKGELEPILVKNPEILEDDMKIVGHQITTPTGPLDILAVDEEGVLAVIELKNEVDEEENQLLQALRYYDWCLENRAWLAHAFNEKGIDPQKEPRLILVAPDFSESLKRLAKYLSLDEVELYRYQAIELPNGEKTVVCNQVFYEERPEPPKISTTQQSIERIKDDDIRNMYSSIIEQLKQRGFEMQSRSKDTISGDYKVKRILRFFPKHHFFAVRLLLIDNTWTARIRIKDSKDWDNFLRAYLDPRIQEMDKQ